MSDERVLLRLMIIDASSHVSFFACSALFGCLDGDGAITAIARSTMTRSFRLVLETLASVTADPNLFPSERAVTDTSDDFDDDLSRVTISRGRKRSAS
jgi:hypothetical protein